MWVIAARLLGDWDVWVCMREVVLGKRLKLRHGSLCPGGAEVCLTLSGAPGRAWGSPGKRGQSGIETREQRSWRLGRLVPGGRGSGSCASLFPTPITHAARVPCRPRWQQRGVW